MQSLTIPTGVHNPNGHTATDVLAALRAVTGSRHLTFRYDLLTSANVYVQGLTCVLSCTVEQNWLADIKRSAKFVMQDTGEIDYLQDRIQPWVRLHIPPYGDDDWVEWPQGVFLLSTPSRKVDEQGVVTRPVEGYDQLQVYRDDVVEDRYTVDADEVYTEAVATLLATGNVSITPSTATLPVAKEWDPGTSKLKIINELLGAVNYNSLSFDEYGVAIVSPYVLPSRRRIEYVYADDEVSVMFPEMEQRLDVFSVPNKWVLVVSEPDREPLVSSYTNNDPTSLTSTISRQRTIVDFRTEMEAADQATLDAKVNRLAFEASQIFEEIQFTTAIMPIHSGNDVCRITSGPLAVNAKYAEHSWSMDLQAGAAMRHSMRRIVDIRKYGQGVIVGDVNIAITSTGMDISDDEGWLATYTNGARTVSMRGPSNREFTEQKYGPATDEFDRVVDGGWGVSPAAGTWGVYGGDDEDYSVTSADGGIIDATAGTGYYARLNDTVDVADLHVVFRVPTMPTTSTVSFSLILGWQNTTNHYRLRWLLYPSGNSYAAITVVVDGSESTVVSSTQVGSGYLADDLWHARATSDGTGNLALTCWDDDDSEPGSPDVSGNDTTFLTGKVGVRWYVSGSEPVAHDVEVTEVTVDAEWPDPPSVTHDTWVRLLDEPYEHGQQPDWDWLAVALADESDDVLATAYDYITGGGNDADYGPLYAPGRAWEVDHDDDGTRQEGSDWNDYLGVSGEYPNLTTPTIDPPEAHQLGCLDCSGFVRTVYGYVHELPMCLSDSADFNGLNIPRASSDIMAFGPGVMIASSAIQPPPMTAVMPGDVLGWDADVDNPEETEGEVDHVGIYLGVDSEGNRRFLSSRKVANGPTLGDLGGDSVVDWPDETNLYSRQLRYVRRF